MANVKVRLKDASNNVLHPETDWSVVQNKPSITVDRTQHAETWSFDGHIEMEAGQDLTLKAPGSEIKVVDKHTSNAIKSLKDYPINWSAIGGKPSGTYVASVATSNAVSGGYPTPSGVKPGIYFYKGVVGNNLIAFVCNDSEALWGWYYDINGQKKDLPETALQYGTNLVELAVYKYTFFTKNF